MVPALTIDELKTAVKDKYLGQEAVIGIMLGRYNVEHIQQAIDESYQYWHLNSGKGFDIYWAGYGEYWGTRKKGQTILKCAESCNGVYFDLSAFVNFKNDFVQTNQINYNDKFQLVLCNVKNGIIKFDEHIIINLEENFNESTACLRDIMENIINLCHTESNVKRVKLKMSSQSFWRAVKGITFAKILSAADTAIGVAGTISGVV